MVSKRTIRLLVRKLDRKDARQEHSFSLCKWAATSGIRRARFHAFTSAALGQATAPQASSAKALPSVKPIRMRSRSMRLILWLQNMQLYARALVRHNIASAKHAIRNRIDVLPILSCAPLPLRFLYAITPTVITWSSIKCSAAITSCCALGSTMILCDDNRLARRILPRDTRPPRSTQASSVALQSRTSHRRTRGYRIRQRVGVGHQRARREAIRRLLHNQHAHISELDSYVGIEIVVAAGIGAGEHAGRGGGAHGEDLVMLMLVEQVGVGEQQIPCMYVFLHRVEACIRAVGRGRVAAGSEGCRQIAEELAQHLGRWWAALVKSNA